MHELSLFTGAGGGLLGTHLLGWRPVGYVEIDDYCQRVIAARIRDGALPVAPIFGDIRTFIRDGYAGGYTGLVDVITGGFPCQPFSVAGKRSGADDARNMWPATIECIRVVGPRYLFLENVPGLVTSGYFGTILGDLAASGFAVRWRVLSAAELGAPHQRDRLWIAAYSESAEWRADCAEWRSTGRNTGAAWHGDNGQISEMAMADTDTAERSVHEPGGEGEVRFRHDVDRGSACGGGGCSLASGSASTRRSIPEPERAGLALGLGTAGERPHAATARGDWWETEPDVGRMADGVAARVDRLRAIGNGQVPAVAAAAWRLLMGEKE